VKHRSVGRSPAPGQLFIRVEDAASLLGISRSLAYDLANQWIDSGGRTGLPAIRLGRRLLVRRSVLEQWATDTRAA
jgi:excisionase family DNA binding protein